MGSQGGVQRGYPLWQPVCRLPAAGRPGRGVWGLSAQFPKGGRVGIRDVSLIGTMRVKENLPSLNTYLDIDTLDNTSADADDTMPLTSR